MRFQLLLAKAFARFSDPLSRLQDVTMPSARLVADNAAIRYHHARQRQCQRPRTGTSFDDRVAWLQPQRPYYPSQVARQDCLRPALKARHEVRQRRFQQPRRGADQVELRPGRGVV